MSSSVENYSPVSYPSSVRARDFLQPFNLPERPINSMATPLAILPSSPIHSSHHYSNSDSSTSSTSQADCAVSTLPTPQPRRPKLSLNTAATPNPRSFGRGNTGLRLDTLSGISPTIRNTFRNTYDPSAPSASSPSQRIASPALPIRSPLHTAQSATTPISSTTSASNTSSDSSATPKPAYAIPHGIRSILRNTPFPRPQHSVMTSTPTSSSSRVLLFPPTRRVSFRPAQSLCEDIVTTRFTARHQDLIDAETDDDDASAASCAPAIRRSERAPAPLTAPHKTVCIDPQLLGSAGIGISPHGTGTDRGKMSPDDARTGDKRESSSPDSEVGGISDSDEELCPKTPVAGRAKKRREWVWTLGPLEGQES